MTRTDRFGQPVTPGAALTLGWGWRSRVCTGPCQSTVAVFEVPAGYLDDLGTFGLYVCGDCRIAQQTATANKEGV